MNKNITEEELLLRKRARRRLVGAIVLVLAAVIILPMIFDEPKPDAERHEIDIHLFPEEDISEIPPLVLPPESLSEDAVQESADQSELPTDLFADDSGIPDPAMDRVEGIEGEASIKKNHIPIPGIKPQQLDVARTQPTNLPAQSAEEFVIQLGAFSDKSKAHQQQQNLLSNGLNAYTETHTVNGAIVTRVRIGPYRNRGAAEMELKNLRKMGLEGVVTSPR